jgi:hypothetical protein
MQLLISRFDPAVLITEGESRGAVVPAAGWAGGNSNIEIRNSKSTVGGRQLKIEN